VQKNAATGYLTILVSMPFDLAPFGWQRVRYNFAAL
jgi:hypothetical protein